MTADCRWDYFWCHRPDHNQRLWGSLLLWEISYLTKLFSLRRQNQSMWSHQEPMRYIRRKILENLIIFILYRSLWWIFLMRITSRPWWWGSSITCWAQVGSNLRQKKYEENQIILRSVLRRRSILRNFRKFLRVLPHLSPLENWFFHPWNLHHRMQGRFSQVEYTKLLNLMKSIFTSSVLRRVAPAVSPDGKCWPQLEGEDWLVDLRPLHPAHLPRSLHLLLDESEVWSERGLNYRYFGFFLTLRLMTRQIVKVPSFS